MTHNDWFENKFLASLKNEQWLSEKQVAICKRYMFSDRYTARKYRLAVGNVEHIVSEFQKGYGRYTKREYSINIEEKVTDRFGSQYSAF